MPELNADTSRTYTYTSGRSYDNNIRFTVVLDDWTGETLFVEIEESENFTVSSGVSQTIKEGQVINGEEKTVYKLLIPEDTNPDRFTPGFSLERANKRETIIEEELPIRLYSEGGKQLDEVTLTVEG